MNIIEMYLNGTSVRKISKQLKIKCSLVYEVLKKENYFAQGKNLEDCIKLKKSLDLYINNPNYLLKDVSAITNIDPEILSKYLRRLGFEPKKRQNTPKINQHIFDQIDSEAKAYWLGFIFADGYIQPPPKDETKMKYVFSFCLAYQDIGHLKKFNDFMGFVGDKVYIDYLLVNDVKKPRCKWSVGNKHLWETLNMLGCTPRKTLTLKAPKIPDELVRHFIRGYFDGDGTLGSYGKYKQPSCSIVGTMNIIDYIIKYHGTKGAVYNHKGHKPETITLSYASKKAIDFIKYIYDDSTIYLDRKYNKFLEMCRLWEKSHKL